MNRIISKSKYGILFSLALFLFSCETDDYTDYSPLDPTSPTISVSGIPASINLIEQDSTFTFTLTMNEAQIVDVVVYIKQTDGTAALDKDFEIVNDGDKVTIPAGSTTGEVKIKILPDEDIEETETFTIQIGDERTANAAITPVTVNFTISNYAAGSLTVDMSWDAVAYNQNGEVIPPTVIADMILQVFDANGDLVDEADGASFESLVLASNLPDGTYYIRAAFYSAEQFPEPVNIDLSIGIKQPGVQFPSFSFPALITTATSELCDLNINLVEVVKTGTSYTPTKIGTLAFDFVLGDFVGTYNGLDGSIGQGFNWRFPNPVDIEISGENLTLDGLNYVWMNTAWGETITASTPVVVTINTDGTLEIATQPYITTDYAGNPYNYSITGSGTYSLCDPLTLHIEYDMYNTTDDYSLGEWLKSNGYSSTDYFIADISLGAKSIMTTPEGRFNVNKPKR